MPKPWMRPDERVQSDRAGLKRLLHTGTKREHVCVAGHPIVAGAHRCAYGHRDS
jgi:hypothetical protein